jgi:hypothetical protein
MAEGMLGGIVGGEEEKPEVEVPKAVASAVAPSADGDNTMAVDSIAALPILREAPRRGERGLGRQADRSRGTPVS